jgi:biopolymer transport protein ExbD
MASNANKRARKKRRAEPQDEPEFQVAPMIDVLLVLTLFFMSITSTELLKKEKNITLPDANHAKKDDPGAKRGQIIINVSWDHNNNTAGFTIDGKAYADAVSLQSYLQPRAADPRSYALIRADKDVQYSNISDVMAACAASGLSKVSFAVITNGQQHHGAPGAPAPAPTPAPGSP